MRRPDLFQSAGLTRYDASSSKGQVYEAARVHRAARRRGHV